MDPGDALDHTLEYVAIGVAAVINIFNPRLMLLHARMFDIHEDVLRQVVDRAKELALTPSANGCTIRRLKADKSIGAVAGAIDHLFSRMGPSMNAF